MERLTSPLRTSIWPSVGGVVAGAVIGVVGFGMLAGGWDAGEPVLLIAGGAFGLGGLIMTPVMIWRAFTGKRGGYGDCPVCGTPMVTDSGEARNLLCHSCASYLDVANGQFTTITEERLAREPYFAAPTPWPDIRLIMSSAVAFSAFDYAQDKLTELMMGKKGNKELGAKWPSGCCVCGKRATRFDTLVVPVTVGGQMRDSKATLIARDVPYCAEHKDGIKFENIHTFGSRGGKASFGIKFRSLAYRDRFFALNRWNWPGLLPR